MQGIVLFLKKLLFLRQKWSPLMLLGVGFTDFVLLDSNFKRHCIQGCSSCIWSLKQNTTSSIFQLLINFSQRLMNTVMLKDMFKNYIMKNIWLTMGFLGSSAGKESTCNAGDPGFISGWEVPQQKE